jgi:two-component system sensor histidine kinase UhpB
MKPWRPASLCCVGLGIHLILLAACIALSLQPSWLAGVGPGWLLPLAAAAGLVQWRLWQDARSRTERGTATAQALGRSQEQLHQIISTLPIPLFIKDPQSQLVMMNAACEQQWGVRFEDVEGTKAAQFFPPEQMARFLADDQAVFAHGQLLVVEELAWNASRGENRVLETRKKPVFDSDGKPAYLLGISIDVTERKAAQDYLQQTLSQVRQLSEHQLTENEDERRQVATGIHDELGQNLLALKIDVALLERRTAGRHPHLHRRVQEAMETLDTTIGSVRTIINSLRPAILDLGLDAALEWQLEQFERRTGIDCVLEVKAPLVPLDAHLTAAVFRIVQESLDNVARHAKASKVTVSLAMRDSHLVLSIVDDGVGIADAKSGAGFGLRAMRERVDAYGGELRINSGYGGGTAIFIQIPLRQLAETNVD